MDYKLVLDVIVAILLVATIVYSVILNNRLSQLRKNRDDLVKLVASFNDATARAEAGIPKLKRAAEDAGSMLQERVEKAQSLRDDLAFMIERADSIANRLEGSVRVAREARPASSPPPPPPRVAPRSMSPAAPSAAPLAGLSMGFDEEDERSEAERELLRALQAAR